MQLAVVQAELNRMNAENQRLRDLLNQVNNNYHVLHMHLKTLTQGQKYQKDGGTIEEFKVIINIFALI